MKYRVEITSSHEYWIRYDSNINHRECGPDVIFADGSKYWFKDGKQHRDGDKPAVILANGSKWWYKDGKLHRDGDEPAVICADGSKEYWVNGVEIR
jgi:hypothetical protein